MADIRLGDRVRIKGRVRWPSPPGYRFTGAEGTVVKWIEYDEVMDEFSDFVYVHLEKADGEGSLYISNNICFRRENIEKV